MQQTENKQIIKTFYEGYEILYDEYLDKWVILVDATEEEYVKNRWGSLNSMQHYTLQEARNYIHMYLDNPAFKAFEVYSDYWNKKFNKVIVVGMTNDYIHAPNDSPHVWLRKTIESKDREKVYGHAFLINKHNEKIITELRELIAQRDNLNNEIDKLYSKLEPIKYKKA